MLLALLGLSVPVIGVVEKGPVLRLRATGEAIGEVRSSSIDSESGWGILELWGVMVV